MKVIRSIVQTLLLVFTLGCQQDSATSSNPRSNIVVEASVSTGSFKSISSVNKSTCAVTHDGRPICWGENQYQQVIPPADLKLKSLSIGIDQACGIKMDNTLVCWGNGTYPTNLGEIKALSQGGSYFYHCAIKVDDSLACWGYGYEKLDFPKNVTGVKYVATGTRNLCLIKSDNSLSCSNLVNYGSVSIPSDLGPVKSVAIPTVPFFIDKGVEWYFRFQTYCAVKQNGSLICWKTDQKTNDIKSFQIDGNFKEVAAGGDHFCAIREDDTVTCFGNNYYGQSTPPQDLGTVIAIVAGGWHTCAIRSDNSISCWGRNRDGEMSFPASGKKIISVSQGISPLCLVREDHTFRCLDYGPDAFIPRFDLPRIDKLKSIVRAGQVSCALREDDAVFCWKYNTYLSRDKEPIPIPIPSGLGKVKSLSYNGFRQICAIKFDDTVVCWFNDRSDETDVTPLPSDLGKVKFLFPSKGYGCAIRMDDTLICWGNSYSAIPKVPADLGRIKKVTGGYSHLCVIKSDDSLFCWGDNWKNQIDIPGELGLISDITAGLGYTCAVRKSDSKVFCWGDNGNETPPRNLGPARSLVSFNVGYDTVCAILSDDSSVICWGSGYAGFDVDKVMQN